MTKKTISLESIHVRSGHSGVPHHDSIGAVIVVSHSCIYSEVSIQVHIQHRFQMCSCKIAYLFDASEQPINLDGYGQKCSYVLALHYSA